MKDINFLIILAYYDRPNMVLNALESVNNLEYDNWKLYFIDDGSMAPGAPIVRKVLKDHMQGPMSTTIVREERWIQETVGKVSMFRIDDTLEDKRSQNGSRHPEFMNRSILDWEGSGDDVVIILCDDDALIPTYLTDLNEYYKNNPEVLYSYCHVAPFDPTKERPNPSMLGRPFWLNKRGAIMPYSAVDSTQVTYRKKVFTELGVKYPSPAHRCLDAALYSQLQDKIGLCQFNATLGQYKGTFTDQLGQRNSGNEYAPQDLLAPPSELFSTGS